MASSARTYPRPSPFYVLRATKGSDTCRRVADAYLIISTTRCWFSGHKIGWNIDDDDVLVPFQQ